MVCESGFLRTSDLGTEGGMGTEMGGCTDQESLPSARVS